MKLSVLPSGGLITPALRRHYSADNDAKDIFAFKMTSEVLQYTLQKYPAGWRAAPE